MNIVVQYTKENEGKSDQLSEKEWENLEKERERRKKVERERERALTTGVRNALVVITDKATENASVCSYIRKVMKLLLVGGVKPRVENH